MFRSEKSAIALLKADHREVEQLFAAFEDADDDTPKQAALASQIGQALTVHAELEETFLYPRVLAAAKKKDEEMDLVCEATVEHGTLRGLISGMNGKSPSDPMTKARVMVLKEFVEHHVKEEEREFFPKLEGLGLDLDAIGEEMATAKSQLLVAVGRPASGAIIRVVDVKAEAQQQAA